MYIVHFYIYSVLYSPLVPPSSSSSELVSADAQVLASAFNSKDKKLFTMFVIFSSLILICIDVFSYSAEDLNVLVVDFTNEDTNAPSSVTTKAFPEAVKSEKPDLILPIAELNVGHIDIYSTCIYTHVHIGHILFLF